MTLSSHLNTYIELLFLSERSGFRSLVNKAEMLLQTNPVFSRLSFSIIRKSIVWHLFVIYLFLSLQLSPGCRLGGVPVAGCGSPRQYLDHDQTYKKKNTQPNIDSEVKSLFPCVLPVLGPLRFVCVYVCTAGIVWIFREQMSGSTRHSLTMNYY